MVYMKSRRKSQFGDTLGRPKGGVGINQFMKRARNHNDHKEQR